MRLLSCVCWMVVTSSGGDHTPKTIKVPITSRSDDARAIYLRGRALSEQLRAHDAYTLFGQALALDPTFAMAEYNLSLTAPTINQRLAHLNKAVALANTVSDGERLFILARQAQFNLDPAKAQQYAETLVAQYPQDERARWVLGNAYFAQSLFDKAVTEYQAAIEVNASYSPAYNSMGYGYRATGNLTAAEKAFQQYIALVPDDPNPYDSYGELLMKMGRFDASIVQYRKALAIDPHFGGSHLGIAADQLYTARYDAAIAESQAYYDAARDDSERRNALLSQVMTYVDQGATDQALRAMDRVFAVARTSGDTVNMAADGVATGDILLDAGRVDAARDSYQRARDLVASSSLPSDVKEDNVLASHYDRARVALAKHDLVTARAEAASYSSGAEARHNDGRVRQAHELNGLLLLHDKDFDRALGELALANPRDPEVLFATAQVYQGEGNTGKAKALAAQAADLYELPSLPYVFVRARSKHVQ